ncbi:MAG TPA: hypothetical protein VK483_09535 [Chitinophagaceae bacterium]|nr:hypothetical protein [Chitinophagaceae bacterium]
MMARSVRRLLAVFILSVSFFISKAQPAADPPVKKEILPYQVLTSGKQITIKSNRNIRHIMLWTSSGHRVLEQRDINAASYTFAIPVDEKFFFLMLGLEGGKIYTEKVGMQ